MYSFTHHPAAGTNDPDRDLLADLQSRRAYPSVSVLLTTRPGSMMASSDVIRLHQLGATVEHRLAAEPPSKALDAVVARWRALAVEVRRAPSAQGLALFVSESRAEVVRLPIPVEDRVVVDPTFATRDLVRALDEEPRYRLLVLSERTARLCEGRTSQLRNVVNGRFPVSRSTGHDRRDRSRQFGRERSDRRDATLRSHLRNVDDALVARCGEEPLPLLVAGGIRHLASFMAMSAQAASVVGELHGSHEQTPTAALAALARPLLEHHRQASHSAAMVRLDGRQNRHRLAEGIDAVWAAAVDGLVDHLWVEETFALPARIAPDGRRLEPADDVDHPEVIDDTVDEVIELVSRAGGQAVVVDDGALTARQRIAALIRT
jgi:hypothetical protein